MTFVRTGLYVFTLLFAISAWSAGVACVVGKKSAFPQYTPLKLTGKNQGSRIEVQDMRGATAMVPRRDLRFGMKCVTVKVDKSRLRQGPGRDYKAAQLTERGKSFIDLGGEDGWTQVQNEKGEKAWINLDHTWSPVSRKMRLSFENEK